MKRGEHPKSHQEALFETAQETRRRAQFLRRKPFVDQHEVYALSKTFFKAYLGKPHELTSHELARELHRVFLSHIIREHVDTFLDKIGLLEYTDTQYSQAEVKLLLQDLEQLVHELVSEHKRQLPPVTRFANWLFGRDQGKHHTVISEYPVIERNDHVTVELNTILEDIYASLDENKVKRAAKHYKELVRKYDQLGASAQHEFYHKVSAAYEAILKQEK